MNNARIICTFDAETFSREVARVLSALDYRVDVCVGRAYEPLVETVRERREAVVLVWSRDAIAQHYMRRWLAETPIERLVEITRTHSYPQLPERRHPIDFSNWSGIRGGAAWRNFEERLRAVERVIEPPKPQPIRAALTMGAVSAGLLVSAGVARFAHDTPQLAPIMPNDDEAIAQTAQQTQAVSVESSALGGPLDAIEPNSLDGLELSPLASRIRGVETASINLNSTADLLAPMSYRDPSLLGRISDLAQSGLREIGGFGASNEDH
jgi:hypothetical protein